MKNVFIILFNFVIYLIQFHFIFNTKLYICRRKSNFSMLNLFNVLFCNTKQRDHTKKKHKHNAYAYLIDNQLKFTIPSSSAPEIVDRK